jgi:hypothetical protein
MTHPNKMLIPPLAIAIRNSLASSNLLLLASGIIQNNKRNIELQVLHPTLPKNFKNPQNV